MTPRLASACLLLLCSAATQGEQDPAVPPALVVTTDTQAYCASLRGELQVPASLPRPVRALRDDGWALCRAGHVRRGIGRLRRALMILHAGSGPVPPPAQDAADAAR